MYRNVSTVVSAMIWILLPKCGLCLMAYMGLFSALGLGTMIRNNLALPIMIMLMAVNLIAVLYMSVIKKEYVYALLSLGAAVLFTVNKISIGSVIINFIAGLILLVAMLRIRLLRLKTKQCIFKTRPGAL